MYNAQTINSSQELTITKGFSLLEIIVGWVMQHDVLHQLH